MANKDSRSNAADWMRDPYEAYYRHVRRRDRAEVAAILGGFFLALVLVSAVFFFWYSEVDQRTVTVIRDTVALND